MLILSSTQQALDLAMRLLTDSGEAAWIEEPHYLGARAAFAAAGVRGLPVPLDEEGMDVTKVPKSSEGRLVYVTPSHQFPTGVTMSLSRRLALLEWAEESDAWILEDDYDSEFRYEEVPASSLQGMDASSRVLYVGNFNKILFPSLRVAFLVVPPALVDSFWAARAALDGGPSPTALLTLALFIEEGHLAAHLRRVREVYRERRDTLLHELREKLGDCVSIGPCSMGLHLTLQWSREVDDEAISAAAGHAGVHLPPLSRYFLGAPDPGLLVTFAGDPPSRITSGVERLARIMEPMF